MDAHEIYEKAQQAGLVAFLMAIWPTVKGVLAWWKARRDAAEEEAEQRANETAEVQVAKITTEYERDSELMAHLIGRVKELEENQREMFEQMRTHTAQSDACVRDAQEKLANEVQKVNAANWVIEKLTAENTALRDEVAELHVEINKLSERINRLEGRGELKR